MRKYIFAIDDNGITPSSPSISIPPSPSPSPSPSISIPPFSSPSPLTSNFDEHPYFFFHTIQIFDNASDVATIIIIIGLILLSFFSSIFIFHLKLKSRQSQHLKNFNSLWSIRLLLVLFITLWATNELLRIPFFRRYYLYTLLPSISIPQQANLCKIQVVMSLGLFEPGFLVTLLYLIIISIKNKSKSHVFSISFVLLMCLPILLLQIIFVFLTPMGARLPMIMHRSSVIIKDDCGNKSVICTYPIFSWIVFAAFGICYLLGLMLSCWKVMAFVINKRIRVRINVLAFTLMTLLPLEIFFLGTSTFWSPQTCTYRFIMLVSFLCVAICCVVGLFILVLKPTTEALAAGSESILWVHRVWSLQLQESYREGDVRDGHLL